MDFPWRKSLDNGFYGQKWSKIEEKKGKIDIILILTKLYAWY